MQNIPLIRIAFNKNLNFTNTEIKKKEIKKNVKTNPQCIWLCEEN